MPGTEVCSLESQAIPPSPTYPLFRIAAQLAGAEITDQYERSRRALAFACNPNNPTGELTSLPDVRPLVVDEAYFEYSGQTAVPLLDDGVITQAEYDARKGDVRHAD